MVAATAKATGTDSLSRKLMWIGIALLIFLVLGKDGGHHWHEWRYAYAGANYSIDEIVKGAFDPGPPPVRSAAETGAWYWGQILHQGLLRIIFSRAEIGVDTIWFAEALYAVFVLLSVAMIWCSLWLIGLRVAALPWAWAGLLSPLSVYLAFKLMPEGLALFISSASILLFTLSQRREGALKLAAVLIAGVFTGLAFLASVPAALTSIGFVLAWAFMIDQQPTASRMVTVVVFVLSSLAAAIGLGWGLFGISPADYILMLGFYKAFVKPASVWVFGVVTGGGFLYVLAALGLRWVREKAARFFILWFVVAFVPHALVSSNYFEARYITVSFLPLVGLAVVGYMRSVMLNRTLRTAVRGLFVLGLPTATALTSPVMPIEMRSAELLRIIDEIQTSEEDSVILVPWTYTDFHFLKLARPAERILQVEAPIEGNGRVFEDDTWSALRAETYGSAFVADADALSRVEAKRFYYVGHGVIPPLSAMQAAFRFVGLERLEAKIQQLDPLVHYKASWMWDNPRFCFAQISERGNYKLFEVTRSPCAQR